MIMILGMVGPWQIVIILLPILFVIVLIVVLIINSSKRRKKRNKALMDLHKHKESKESPDNKPS